jgi:hemolysin D
MSEPGSFKPPVVRPQLRLPAKGMQRRDQAFLPEALEVIEMPADPARIAFLYAICLMFAVALAWSYFGYLDVFAVAPGKVQTTGRTKLIQPVDSGQVVAIRVQNGSLVKAGDVLIELDPSEVIADQLVAQQNLFAARAEIARRKLAVATADSGQFSPLPKIDWDSDIPRDVRIREDLVLRTDLSQLASSLLALEAQRRQKEAELAKFGAQVRAQMALMDPMAERYSMRKELLRSGSTSRATFLDSVQEVAQAETTRASLEGNAAVAEVAIEVLKADFAKMRDTFINDNATKLADAERRADEITQRLAKASVKVAQKTLTAPISGTVQSLTVINLNQVVGGGQELMRIVPEGLPLEIEAYVLNRDIGFVREGQPATIKVDSFPFTRYGTIDGVVVKVASDAIPGAEAAQNQITPAPTTTNPPQGGQSASAVTTAAQKAQDLVYQIIIQPSATSIMVDGQMMPLSSGMSVSVEIKTEERRVIDYVLSPLLEVTSTAMRER